MKQQIEEKLKDLIKKAEEYGVSERAKKDLEEYIPEYITLIQKMAQKYVRSRVEHEDLIQEALIGLLLADRGFDPERSPDFHTYAVTRIKGKMYDYCIGNDSPIYIPTHVAKAASYVRQMRRLLEREPALHTAGIGPSNIILTLEHEAEDLLPETSREKLRDLKRKLKNIATNSKTDYEGLAYLASDSLSLVISDDVLLKYPSEEDELNNQAFSKELDKELRKLLGRKHYLVLSYHLAGYSNEDITYKLYDSGYKNRFNKRISRQAVKSILDDALKRAKKSKRLEELLEE